MNQTRNYQTKQKLIIYNFLKEHSNDHMTAEFILSALKDENNPVSKATLYRFLDYMIESGEVRKYNIDNLKSCYQYVGDSNNQSIYHLLCNTCGRVFHVDNNEIDILNNQIEKNRGFKIDQSKTVFYGICKECQDNEKSY